MGIFNRCMTFIVIHYHLSIFGPDKAAADVPGLTGWEVLAQETYSAGWIGVGYLQRDWRWLQCCQVDWGNMYLHTGKSEKEKHPLEERKRVAPCPPWCWWKPQDHWLTFFSFLCYTPPQEWRGILIFITLNCNSYSAKKTHTVWPLRWCVREWDILATSNKQSTHGLMAKHHLIYQEWR